MSKAEQYAVIDDFDEAIDEADLHLSREENRTLDGAAVAIAEVVIAGARLASRILRDTVEDMP